MLYPDIFSHFPVIDLDDIILRKISVDHDYINYFRYITHPYVTKYLSKDDVPDSLEKARIELNYWSKLFDYQHSVYWGISLKKENQLIGTCGFNYWNKTHKRAEISYDLDYEFWGKGMMTKAVKSISDFAFQTMKLQRIQATVAIDNIPSIKVLEKSGYIQEGLMKNFGVLQDKGKDFYMYGLF